MLCKWPNPKIPTVNLNKSTFLLIFSYSLHYKRKLSVFAQFHVCDKSSISIFEDVFANIDKICVEDWELGYNLN